jgi:g-D-glutamyl-meso-diaminopimelate peptidase
MVNPDGVAISQTQQLNEYQQSLYQNDKAKGYAQESGDAYAAAWKANSIGIDLNRNFPCGWEPINDRPEPSYQGFKGTEPFTAAESIALRDYTLAHKFDATVSYHSSGSIIYFEYGKKQPVNAESRALADAVSVVNKYTLINSTGVNGGGYKDWVMEELGIPSITIEIGSGDSPLQYRELYNVFDRNYGILPAIAQWLQS